MRSREKFARELGAEWAGSSTQRPPEELDAAILFTPVGALVPAALRAERKGGKVICGGIHMSDIPSFPYRLLWEERQIVSVANLTRRDGRDFLLQAERTAIQTRTTAYRLEQANEALEDLRSGRFDGAAVLVPKCGQFLAEFGSRLTEINEGGAYASDAALECPGQEQIMNFAGASGRRLER